MRRLILISWLTSALAGCFYTDPINERPNVQIHNDATQPHRGDMLHLTSEASDPEGDHISYVWRVYACGAIDDPDDSDENILAQHCGVHAKDGAGALPANTGVGDSFDFIVPFDYAANQDEPNTPTQSVVVILQAKDEEGALARPGARLVLPVIDQPTSIQLVKSSRYGFVKSTPVELFARVMDDDDPPEGFPPELTPFGPSGQCLGDGTCTLAIPPDDPEIHEVGGVIVDAEHGAAQFHWLLTPSTTGTYSASVTASPPVGIAQTATIDMQMVDDGAPCLNQLVPIVPPAGNTLPLTGPTLFRVATVKDDLDPYPFMANDPIFGPTRFEWSLQAPGQPTHAVVPGATGNSFSIDPAGYAAGDVLELRVTIFDRKNTLVSCPDGSATCSTISDNACLQRQTWRVEVR